MRALAVAALLAAAPAFAQNIPKQASDPALHARLPPEILARQELVSVHSGSFPPYEIVGDDRSLTGATADLATALGELLGQPARNH